MITTIILTVILITGPGKEDISADLAMASLEECRAAEHDWLAQDAKAAGAAGFAAGCSITYEEAPSTPAKE